MQYLFARQTRTKMRENDSDGIVFQQTYMKLPTITKKRKHKLGGASQAVKQSQALACYKPVARTLLKALSLVPATLLEQAFFNPPGLWSLTSNCIVNKKGDKGYRIKVTKRGRLNDIKGKYKYSLMHGSILEAENAAFDFRCSLESQAVRARLEVLQADLAKIDESSINYKRQVEKCMETYSKPALVNRERELPTKKAKTFGMSSNPHLHARTKYKQSTNPNNAPYSYEFLGLSSEAVEYYARKIHNCVNRWKARRAYKSF
jgi:hypothetical protein